MLFFNSDLSVSFVIRAFYYLRKTYANCGKLRLFKELSICFSVEAERDLSSLQKHFGAGLNIKAYQDFNESLKAGVNFKVLGDDNRIYPNTFGHVLTQVGPDKEKVFSPMRYRVRPANSKEEVPSKYNVFNARLDSLQSRATWSNIFMRNHGIFPFKKFYEWVEYEERKTLINFSPKDYEFMYAPCLYDKWESPDKKYYFYSFAIITTDPNEEVLRAGHDRSPIFLKSEYIDRWLSPQEENIDDVYSMLKDHRKVYYENSLAI
ncbi:MAG: SOS response-associated peptidase [Oligoflexia bacterium]|nr:SOS response-associated peptidase [Oligoflexia bacterium]